MKNTAEEHGDILWMFNGKPDSYALLIETDHSVLALEYEGYLRFTGGAIYITPKGRAWLNEQLKSKETKKVKVYVITADKSKWLLDDAYTAELLAEYGAAWREATPDAIHDWLVDSFHKEPLDDWLYPNAHLDTPSSEASMIFDGVARGVPKIVDDEPDEDDEEDDNPYKHGWEGPTFDVVE